MAKKSSSGTIFTVALLGIGGYFAYENWPAISAWIDTIIPQPTAGAATASGFYPNSPVPTSYSTSQTFVDSSGNQWQFSTQTGAWVIASPGPAVPQSSPGTTVSTVVPQPPQVMNTEYQPGAPVAAVPASPGTVVPLSTPSQPTAPLVAWGTPGPTAPIIARVVSTAAPGAPTTISEPIYGMPHYRGY